MLKSIAGKYRDIVTMAPVININADKLHSIWTDAMKEVEKIGFDVAVTMTDGHSSNMNFFNNKLLKNKSDTCLSMESGSKNIPFYDNTHIFKCPSFPQVENMQEVVSPSFSHLNELYMLEKGKHQKIAHKLTEQVLHPKPIEKTNVKLADAAFHESTINALRYYGTRGYGHFKDTAIFLQIIRDWFSTINVKSKDYGKLRNAIHRNTINEDLSYLSLFCDWLQKWKDSGMKGLSKPTFECAIRSCKAILSLVPYLFERYPDLDFILLGNICSDFLEGRFG